MAGVTMGWLFRLLGIFLGLCLILVAYMENYIAVIIALSVFMLVLYRFLTKTTRLVEDDDYPPVITSYSIHYTKLYDPWFQSVHRLS